MHISQHYFPQFSGRDDCEISFYLWALKAQAYAERKGFYIAFISNCTQESADTKEIGEVDGKAAKNTDAVYFLIMNLTHDALYNAVRESKTNAHIMWECLLEEYQPRKQNYRKLQRDLLSIGMPPDQKPQILYDEMKKIEKLLAEQQKGFGGRDLVSMFLDRLPPVYEHTLNLRRSNMSNDKVVATCNLLWSQLYPDKASSTAIKSHCKCGAVTFVTCNLCHQSLCNTSRVSEKKVKR